ncbi:zinc finger, ring-type containing protein [Grosmannia clavigera kw1407]|uniref:Zinc finger, ring-type containing protein n=1 Tax=Grosmannia clavigera (strain kw1407 / UAMH 11150) TaxID=655863 RepID=F0XS93_GROCL|nr:zinc finger, ring-type containing protein [Grosmannia clavigera kw1407]EFW99567.1 zinc finger, ring-type containing protein [Grosmannia clavigera kw1407]
MASPSTTLDPIDDAAAPYEYTTDFYASDPILECLYSSGDGSYILDFDAHLIRLSQQPFMRGAGPAASYPSSQLPGRTTATRTSLGDSGDARRSGQRGDDSSLSAPTPADDSVLPPFLQSSPPRTSLPQQQLPRDRLRPSTPRGPELNSDDYLQLLATDNFSSPSIFGRGSPAERTTRSGSQPKVEIPSTARHQKSSPLDNMPQTRRRSSAAAASRLRGASTVASGSSAAAALPGSYPDATASSPITEASPTRTRTAVKRRRGGEPVTAASTSASTSASASASASAYATLPLPASSSTPATGADSSRTSHTPKKRPRRGNTIVLDDDLFGSDDDGIDVVNLTGIDRPGAASQEDVKVAIEPTPAPSNKVKLASYQCAICMDDVTNLVVTHCGHLYCGTCLHSSLYMDASRKACPICRQKIELRSSGAAKSARSYFPLELKLMTRNRQGKQPARQS